MWHSSDKLPNVNFLDVTLNLNTGKLHPYSKPNNTPLYVHNKSNHPATILRNIPLPMNKRLTETSSDEESQTCQTALDKSGYKHQLKFKHPLINTAARNTTVAGTLSGIILPIVET